MIDVNGYYAKPLRSVLEELHLPEDEINQFLDEVRSHFPESPQGRIEYRSKIPEISLVEGELDHHQISFTKRYKGHQKTEYILNRFALGQTFPCEPVQYTGTVSPSFETISGDWLIAPNEEFKSGATGTFELIRQTDQ